MKINPAEHTQEMDLTRVNEYELREYPLDDDGQKHPFIIICPGGAYMRCAGYSEAYPLINEMHDAGFSVFVCYYRYLEKAMFPNPEDDLANSVRYLFDNAERLHLDTTHYFVMGFSAGGHLVSNFGTTVNGWKKYGLQRPTALILSYPVISLRACRGDQTMRYHIGEDASEELIHLTSVDEQVTEEYPPVFLWRAEGDLSVPTIHRKLLEAACRAHNVPFECHEYPLEGHGQGRGLGTPCEPWLPLALEYMQKACR